MNSTKLICMFILVLFIVEITKANFEANDTTNELMDGCICIQYNCGCCQHIKWDSVHLNGLSCLNVSYLDKDIGISVTLTYNDFAIINETVSARNPPPLCVGEDIIDYVKADICLRIYDINITSNKFHACFQLLGRLTRIKLPSINLGCINQKISNLPFKNAPNNKIRYNEIEQQPIVIMV